MIPTIIIIGGASTCLVLAEAIEEEVMIVSPPEGQEFVIEESLQDLIDCHAYINKGVFFDYSFDSSERIPIHNDFRREYRRVAYPSKNCEPIKYEMTLFDP